LIVLLTALILVYILYALKIVDLTSIRTLFFKQKSIYCYRLNASNLPSTLLHLDNIKIEKQNNIFFHETSCRHVEAGEIMLFPRQACAIESAALMNPHHDIYVTFSSPGTIGSDKLVQHLLTYPNIKFVYLNFGAYTKNTPIESLYRQDLLDKSEYAESHASDILRYLTLWKFGGIYLDLDIVVVKSLENLKLNFAAIESDVNVAAGIMGFENNGYGKMLAESCVLDLAYNYKPHEWGNNGPGVISRLSRKLCNTHFAKDMVDADCNNFTLYPSKLFYPIRWQDWKLYFNQERVANVMEMCQDAYVIHVWNKHSSGTMILKHDKNAYSEFAKKYCPKVFRQCDAF